ncbi:hypothetical protein WA026_021527 [Henosepilachna vigintioctopunctata]|uniref:Uncharacterized protein n=1 Tax=Henosepilachna vigintioctopunctata TaxID=420089 RepID=A0AAW1VGF2_9CUCU
MAPKRKATKEEILRKKREAERKRYEKIKNDPQKREELREKERLKYLKKKKRELESLDENRKRKKTFNKNGNWKKIYEDKSKLNIEDVYTDSESENEAGPSSAVVQVVKSGDFIIDKSKLNVEDVYTDSESENEAGPSSTIVQAFKTGDYIVVKLLGKTNMEYYRYIRALSDSSEEEMGCTDTQNNQTATPANKTTPRLPPIIITQTFSNLSFFHKEMKKLLKEQYHVKYSPGEIELFIRDLNYYNAAVESLKNKKIQHYS